MSKTCNTIVLHGPASLADKDGVAWPVKSVEIDSEGYIPDVYVHLGADCSGVELYDDKVFLGRVMALLRTVGYAGEGFGRAELGMQGADYIALEPNKDFDQFAKAKGWVNLDEAGGAPAAGEVSDAGDAAQEATVAVGAVTLEAFVAEQLDEIERFRASWIKNARVRPDTYPLTLAPGDWFEQFLAFQTIGAD